MGSDVITRSRVEGSDLYRKAMAFYDANDRNPELQHKVWDGTPYILDVYTGPVAGIRDMEIREWCHENFGDEARPIHGRDGDWYRGSATIYGFTWFGFRTQAMMNDFLAAWPEPNIQNAKYEQSHD